MRLRTPLGALLVAMCFSAVAPMAASAQARRAGDERSPEADEKRQRALSRLLLARSRNMSSVEIDGHNLFVHSGKVETSHADYQALESVSVGDIVITTSAAAMKLRSEADLRFGDVTVRTGNVAENFPGTYSVFLKRTGDGWALVFNNEADIWGTQRDPAHDASEVGGELRDGRGRGGGAELLSSRGRRWRQPRGGLGPPSLDGSLPHRLLS